MTGFVTGSTIYGKLSKSSDVDLVILVDNHTRNQLVSLSDKNGFPIKFGRLNLILAYDEAEYECWKLAKEECVKLCKKYGPLTKEQAITVHNGIALEKGIPFNSTKEGKSGR